MVEKSKKVSPPYATFGSFLSFINKLRDTTVPNRIDPSVFGNASGSISYSVIAALKYLRLIDENGVPQKDFLDLIQATEEDRKPLLRSIVQRGYPSLFGGPIDLKTTSAGQFDEHIRKEFEVQGSTVDKIATFFISAAKLSDIEISPHLQARKPTSSSSSSKKSTKQRRRTADDVVDEGRAENRPPPRQEVKALEYQLIDLMSEPDVEEDVKQSIWSLVQYLTARKAKGAGNDRESD